MVELVGKFKEILKSKEVEMLEGWMVETNSLEIRVIGRFVRDIKRIMYRRSKFQLLKAKALLLEGAR